MPPTNRRRRPKRRPTRSNDGAGKGRIMDLDHDTLVAFSKSWGLFYLIAFAIGVCVYTFWPSNRKRFDEAKQKILDRDDGHGSRGSRSRQRPRNDRTRMERHQGTRHARSARRPDLPDRHPRLCGALVDPDADLAAGNDLHQGPAWHRPAQDRRGRTGPGRMPPGRRG